MGETVRVLVSKSTDPYLNLALEKRLFRTMSEDDRLLLFFRNSPCVVIGRFQNPFLECSLEKMERDGIPLARRQSGGGAVYHDPGNLNFSLFCSRERYSRQENFRIITGALNSTFGLDTRTSGRNDILLHGKKISGSAFRQTSSRALHHGTLLLDADLCRLQEYLTPRELAIKSAGIRSVRSEVANLKEFRKDISWEAVIQAVTEEFLRMYGTSIETEILKEKDVLLNEQVRKEADSYRAWEWIFGKSPKFSITLPASLPGSGVSVVCSVEHGLITGVSLMGDEVKTEAEKVFLSRLLGKRFETGLVKKALEQHLP